MSRRSVDEAVWPAHFAVTHRAQLIEIAVISWRECLQRAALIKPRSIALKCRSCNSAHSPAIQTHLRLLLRRYLNFPYIRGRNYSFATRGPGINRANEYGNYLGTPSRRFNGALARWRLTWNTRSAARYGKSQSRINLNRMAGVNRVWRFNSHVHRPTTTRTSSRSTRSKVWKFANEFVAMHCAETMDGSVRARWPKCAVVRF